MKKIVVLLTLIFLVQLPQVGFSSGKKHRRAKPAPSKPTQLYCYYRVDTSDDSRVTVTYTCEGGGTSQRDVTTTWVSEKIPVQKGDFVYISAQRKEEGGGTVTVYIYQTPDGGPRSIYDTTEEVKEASSSGEFVIATASGSF